MKDNPIVTGAYVNWLVNQSVQKDVLGAQIIVDKLTKEVKYLKGDMVSQGYLIAIIDLEDIAKDVADNALATQKRLQGESQGVSSGYSLKEVQEEGPTTLVVCDTGYLGGSVGN